MKELADKEQDVDKKMTLRKLYRSLQGVSNDWHATLVRPLEVDS